MSQDQTSLRSQDEGRPDEQQLETLLASLTPVPGRGFYTRMRSSPWATQVEVSARRRSAFPAGSAVARWVIAGLLLVALIAATPQGRAMAQGILRFFTRADSQTREISTEPAPARLLFQDQCGSALAARCSIEEVRSMVEFPLLELRGMPEGMDFVGATGGPDRVFMTYQGERGIVILAQAPRGEDELEDWAVGPAADVESVVVRGAAGEYVAGSWGPATQAPDASVAWDAWPATQTLRWQDQGIRFTLSFRAFKTGEGPVFGRDDLLGLAGSLTAEPVASLPASDPARPLQEIEQAAGFSIQEATWLPAGYAFDHATYSTEHALACLYYRYQDQEGWPLLTIAQANPGSMPDPADLLLSATYQGQPVAAVVEQSQVPIGGAVSGQGTLTVSGVDTSRLCGGGSQFPNLSLFWETEERGFVLFGNSDQYDGRAFLSLLEMQRVAEGLTGVATPDPAASDPGRLLSIEAAESLAGFNMRSPSQVPEGFEFSYAAYRDVEAPEVLLLYLGSTRDSIGRSHGYLVSETTGSPNTLEQVAMGGDYEWTTVDGEPAVYRQMCWDDTSSGLDASCYLELSWFEAGLRFDVFANLPGAAVDREALFDMAASMR